MQWLLDWLSAKYNVLFIVSAGNHPGEIHTGLNSRIEVEKLDSIERQNLIIKALYQDSRNRRLLSPAESINSITVGSAHFDKSDFSQNSDAFDPFNSSFPSPLSPFGGGYRKSIKPDVIFPGGRQLYQPSMEAEKAGKIEIIKAWRLPGNQVAFQSTGVGNINKTSFCRGTSNATALLSRAASQCHDVLIQLFQDQAQDLNIDYQPYIVPLLKSMLVHGSSWGELRNQLEQIIQIEGVDSRKTQYLVSKWLGYGKPDINRVLDCTKQRASLLGFGKLSGDQAHIFRLPLPDSLESRIEWRRLTVTLAWLSPIIPTNQKYRAASLWFELENQNKSITKKRTDAQWQTVRRGTVQHEVFEGTQAIAFSDERTLDIKVNCVGDAAKVLEPVAYGLIVSLEVKENVDIPIYNEIRNAIAHLIQIKQHNN